MARILIIEDSGFARRTIGKILRDGGHEPLEADGGHEGLDKAEKYEPDCISLDLLMPEVDGFDVLSVLRDKGLDIPTIVLSADIQGSTRERCFDLGAFDFINKPPKADELLRAIQKALDSTRGAQHEVH